MRYARASGSASSAPRLANACASVGLPSAPSERDSPAAPMTGVLGDATWGLAKPAVPRGGTFMPRDAARRSIWSVAMTLARRPRSAASSASRMLTVKSSDGLGRAGEGGGRASLAVAVAPGRAPASFELGGRRYGVVGAGAAFASSSSSHTESSGCAAGLSARKCALSSTPMGVLGITSGLASSRSKRLRSARSFSPAADIARAALLARAPRRTRARVELCPVARAEENKHEAVQLI